jgi:hypothetical protein
MKVSELIFVAAIAAQKILPADSLALITRRDALAEEWCLAGCPTPLPTELTAASDAVRNDPLANAAMQLRVMGNEASRRERDELQARCEKEAA